MKALPLPCKRLHLRVARNKERKKKYATERKWRVSLKIETTGLIRRKASSITAHDGYTCTTMTINSKKERIKIVNE